MVTVPEFLVRAEAVDAGKRGYAMEEPGQSLTADDYELRRDAKRRTQNHLDNLARMEAAIADVTAQNVKAARTLEDKPPLDDIAERIAKLTFGDMVAFAEGLVKVQGYEPTDDPAKMAAFLHKWASGARSWKRGRPIGPD